MTRNEFINSSVYAGKIVYIDSITNQMWSEELLSISSKKAKALLRRFPKGGTFKKNFIVKFMVKGETNDFDLNLEEESK